MRTITIALFATAVTGVAQAGPPIVLDPVDRGWYDSNGTHDPSNDNYVTGEVFGTFYHNWFVFDLSGITENIVSMQLVAFNPDTGSGGYTSPDPTETYTMYDVSTDPNTLINGTGGVGAFDDLGSGTEYGEHIASSADNGTFVTIDLNAAAIADANAAGGGLFGLGAAITTHNNISDIEFLFGFTGSFDPADGNTQLIIVTGPREAGPLLDIKPGSCPNPLNRNSQGVLPVALLGTDDLDVSDVVIKSLAMSRADGVGGSVSPIEGPPGPHTVIADVATPFNGELCDCHELTGDGIDDLSMKFRRSELVEVLQLNDVPNNELVELCVSGTLEDGTEFLACDCVRMVGPGGPVGLAEASVELINDQLDDGQRRPDLDGDGIVGVPDVIILLTSWGNCQPDSACAADLDGDHDVDANDLINLLARLD